MEIFIYSCIVSAYWLTFLWVELHDGLEEEGRNYADASNDVRTRSKIQPTQLGILMKRRRYIYIYILCILSSSMWRGREILFAARDEKAISFRWSPLITHPVYQGLPPLAVETGSLYLEDQCFSIATIWRQSNNNTSPWLSLFSLCFRSIR